MNFGAMFNYTTELYPTSIRTSGLGFTASMSRIGGMLAPQLGLLTSYDQRLPYAIIGRTETHYQRLNSIQHYYQ